MNRSLLIATVLLAVAPAGARAATVEISDPTGTGTAFEIAYRADPGETNQLTLRAEGAGGLRFTDPGATFHDLPDECQASAGGAVCTSPAQGWQKITAVLGDRDDTADAAGVDARIEGGAGADQLQADKGVLVGGTGSDVLDGTTGPSSVSVSYDDHFVPVSVTLDGVANDGGSGEADNVVGGVATVIGGGGDDFLSRAKATGNGAVSGGAGNDHIVGSPADDSLRGDLGDDRIESGAGNDELDGGGGADILRGGTGIDHVSYATASAGVNVSLDDRPGDGRAEENDDVGEDVENLTGGPGDDTLIGSAANNELIGAGGTDTIYGEAGDDHIVAGAFKQLSGGPGRDRIEAGGGGPIEAVDNEVDTISCGIGEYVLHVDAIDKLIGCKQPPPVQTPVAVLSYRGAKRVRVGERGHIRVAFVCAGAPCRGRLSLRYGGVKGTVIGRSSFKLAVGSRPARLSVAISKKGRRALKRDRKHTVTLVAQVGQKAPATVGALTLLRPR